MIIVNGGTARLVGGETGNEKKRLNPRVSTFVLVKVPLHDTVIDFTVVFDWLTTLRDDEVER